MVFCNMKTTGVVANVGAGVALLLVLAMVRASAQPPTDADQIRARRESSNAAIARHDVAGVGAIFATNVIVVTSNSVHRDGRGGAYCIGVP